MPTAEATKAKFRTPVKDLRVVRVPRRRRMADNGEQYFTDGDTITFDGFSYETDDPERIAFLRRRMEENPSGSTNIVEISDAEMAPDSGDALDLLTEATAKGDTKGIADLLAEEKARYKRPDVIRAAEGALKALKK